ncbi:MAG: aconitate hydratase AcnA [Anaerolineales bacterium]|nr:aconitate hydratase AcnA [Anaerolineales bacterium]
MTESTQLDPFGARAEIDLGGGAETVFRLAALEEAHLAPVLARLPYSIRILLESLLRNCDGQTVTEGDVAKLAAWKPKAAVREELPFKPARLLMQDFSGVPCVVDLAAMRDAVKRLGGDPSRVNPLLPADLVIDHSIQVDSAGCADAMVTNVRREFERNRERYQFLRWGAQAFRNLRVIPPATGIIHQINLEYLASVVSVRPGPDGKPVALPDTLVGTDSHTTMVNGLGALGWGVGGIEAEAVMLGAPLYFLAPDVVGVKLIGALREGVTATDVVLTLVQTLRKHGVVEKFVEFCGPGLAALSAPDRATLANMAPEYGATCGYFPVDGETLAFLRLTGRAEADVVRVERYCKEQGLFRTAESPDPDFTSIVEFDLSAVEPSIAGPRRPQDRIPLKESRRAFRTALKEIFGKDPEAESPAPGDGAVVIAAITSCTNTSNPYLLFAAGLLAKKAAARGMKVPAHVKTSFAPGSRAAAEYLQAAGLTPHLEQLGFHVVGFGCATCIGNSGPLAEEVAQAIREHNLVACAVLSGNRNFEGRIHALVKANYIASPPLVVAYALAGSMEVDVAQDPLGKDAAGKDVALKEIWPSRDEIRAAMHAINPEMFRKVYADIGRGPEAWNAIPVTAGELFAWDSESTYILEPPFFEGMTTEPIPPEPIVGARALGFFGDSITTDHISPAGAFSEETPAGRYLLGKGVARADFNSYGTRRGNHEVMMRGTFANIRLKNEMREGLEGGWTLHLPDGAKMSFYEAAMQYRKEGTPLIVIAGKEYGTGSSRDWAAKGVRLLGVRAVLAQSFERIHRSNLVGMGVLPLQFKGGQNAEQLGLTGDEIYSIRDLGAHMKPRMEVSVEALHRDGSKIRFNTVARLDTPVEVEYYVNGGILPAVARKIVAS